MRQNSCNLQGRSTVEFPEDLTGNEAKYITYMRNLSHEVRAGVVLLVLILHSPPHKFGDLAPDTSYRHFIFNFKTGFPIPAIISMRCLAISYFNKRHQH